MIRVHKNGMGTRSNAARRPVPQMDAQNALPADETAQAGQSGSKDRLEQPAELPYASKAIKARTNTRRDGGTSH